MTDLYKYLRFAECKHCGTRYHVDQETGNIRCNGRTINRCIAAHKQSDPPEVHIENAIRHARGEDEVRVVRNDWYGPAGIVLEKL